ncbi:hypothetical protein P2318_19840 [Myxococcaceae bacterium GXIMD 01537]
MGATPPGHDPSLVKDIVDAQGDSAENLGARQFVTAGAVTFFIGDTGETGSELWKTDGTSAGTTLVKDLTPGSQGTQIEELVAVGDTLFFAANVPFHGSKLWKSDGTAAGTVPVKEPQSELDVGVAPHGLTACQGTLFFQSGDAEHGTELWKSDGTAEGTVLVKDIRPGPWASLGWDLRFACVNGTLLFAADDGEHGLELWGSDGTAEGTQLLADIRPGWAGSGLDLYRFNSESLGGTLLFVADDGLHGAELWRTDGTAEGTVLVKDIAPGYDSSFWSWSPTPMPLSFTRVGGAVFFTADDLEHGMELWKSDGTAEGTVLVSDLNPGWGGTSLSWIVDLDGTAVFMSWMDSAIYTSDGTADGTQRLVNHSPPWFDGWGFVRPVVVNHRLLLPAADENFDWEPWVSDGTEAGTTRLMDLNPFGSSSPSQLTRAGEVVYFSAADNQGILRLWRTDGRAEGTVPLGTRRVMRGSWPEGLTDWEGTLYFEAFAPDLLGRQLWKTDGTAEGTALVKDLGPTSGTSGPFQLTPAEGQLFFFFDRQFGLQPELWRTDGTESGTVQLRQFSGYRSGAALVASLGSKLVFTDWSSAQGVELWVSDGTAGGTTLLKDLNPGRGDSRPEGLVRIGDALFFTAFDPTHGRELWTSDGTPEGTRLFLDVVPGVQGSDPRGVISMNGTLFFTAYDALHGRELWKSDGTPEGTVLVKDIRPGNQDEGNPEPISGIYDLTPWGEMLFFTVDDGVHGRELWRSDGTAEGTVLVKDILPGRAPSLTPERSVRPIPAMSRLTVAGSAVYFAANDGEHGYELWKSDGTEEGTVLVKDILPGAEGSSLMLAPFLAVGRKGTLAFTASNGVNGLELWLSNGTAEGTRQVRDLAAGPYSASPGHLTVSGDRLFFAATSDVYGRELWSLNRGAFTAPPHCASGPARR